MSLLGIDIGTTGCKAAVFTIQGEMLALAYEEYDILRPQPGWAELDAEEVWGKVKAVIRRVALQSSHDPITALSVSSLGEALVPVTAARQILGRSILNFDVRGAEYLPPLAERIENHFLYSINGNILGNHYGLTKLMWQRDHMPELYRRADKFLPWSSFIAFMLGADPVVDYSLANRLLLFDLEQQAWSPEILAISGLDSDRLPALAASGTTIGAVTPGLTDELGLPPNVAIVTGAHDQCANAVGCGVIQPGLAVLGMGTFMCLTPVFQTHQEPSGMIRRGLNTEHHAIPGQFVSFIYNQGGSLVKWFRDTFAGADVRAARQAGRDIYAELFAEMPAGPSPVIVLPHFSVTGPPGFIADSAGVVVGLKLETGRGAILKGILEGTSYYLKECIDSLPGTGIEVAELRATGGGSKSAAWVQLCADIFERPIWQPRVLEAGALGAAILAGVGQGVFVDFAAAVEAMIRLVRSFEPDLHRSQGYAVNYAKYRQLWPAIREFMQPTAGG
jgi:xylulokinase